MDFNDICDGGNSSYYVAFIGVFVNRDLHSFKMKVLTICTLSLHINLFFYQYL